MLDNFGKGRLCLNSKRRSNRDAECDQMQKAPNDGNKLIKQLLPLITSNKIDSGKQFSWNGTSGSDFADSLMD